MRLRNVFHIQLYKKTYGRYEFVILLDMPPWRLIGSVISTHRAKGVTPKAEKDPAEFAPLFGAGLAGLMVGALVFGSFGDRVGRKPLLLVCVGAFGLASLVSAFAPSIGVLIALRFMTGLGLAGAMPKAITLASKF